MILPKLFHVIKRFWQCWATDWMIGGSSPSSGWEFFSSPLHPDWLWGPQHPIQWVPWGKSSWGVELITQLHQVLRSRMHGAIHPLPQYFFILWCSV